MTTDRSKTNSVAPQEQQSQPQPHPYPQPVPYPPQAFNGAPYPVPGPGPYPPFFAYPPPPDGAHGENGQNGVHPAQPYMMAFAPPPPGMMYAFSPPGQGFAVPQNPPVIPALRPKRKQVKMACTNCAAACKRCDETRPCERCQKYGVADSCVDGQRKERQKGIKRGPYKRKNKEGDWSVNGQQPSTSSTTAAALHAVAQFTPPEGYYPVYYPPPGFMPHPHEPQPGQEGSPPHPNGQPMMPYIFHPGGFPPYPYGHPGAMYPPPPQPQPQTMNPVDSGKKADEPSSTANAGEEGSPPAVVQTKKRARVSKTGEPKTKKVKARAKGPKDGEGAGDREGSEADPVLDA